MKKLLLNQKSALLYSDIETYVSMLKIYENKFIIFPTDLYVKDFSINGFNVGVQNIAETNVKNQTGEVTAEQAKSVGARYTIIGHSERRLNQKEDGKVLLNKFRRAMDAGLDIVYCVGENLVDYKLKETEQVILKELDDIFKSIDKLNVNLYIAYEPIWAIGTGITPTSFEIEKTIKFIKGYLEKSNIEAEVLYGGSVNDENIENLLNTPNIDGFLVGGASNDYKKVIKMCEILMNSTK